MMVGVKEPLGEYIGIYLAKTNKIEGVITSLLCYLMDEKIIDGVLAAKKLEGLKGEIIVAKSKEEIINAAGSRWQVLPFTAKLKETIENEDLKKIAIVGLPCQIHFLRQMRIFPLLETSFSNRIRLLISLFCYGTFAHESILNYLKSKYDVDASDIQDIKITSTSLQFIGKKKIEIPFEEIAKYLQIGCLLCPDYTGVASDISAGNFNNKTIIITRNEDAEKILHEAVKKGYFSIDRADKNIIEKIEKKAREKIQRASEYIARIL